MSQTFYITRKEDGYDERHKVMFPKSQWERQRPYETKDEFDMELLVEELAKRFYDDRDGWEWWRPNETETFEVFDEAGESLGLFDVHLEFRPDFNVDKHKEVQG